MQMEPPSLDFYWYIVCTIPNNIILFRLVYSNVLNNIYQYFLVCLRFLLLFFITTFWSLIRFTLFLNCVVFCHLSLQLRVLHHLLLNNDLKDSYLFLGVLVGQYGADKRASCVLGAGVVVAGVVVATGGT